MTEKFDRFKNQTIYSLRSFDVGQDLKLGGFFLSSSESGEMPSVVMLVITTSHKDWTYLRCHELSMLADGKPVPILKVDHDGTVGSGYVFESVAGMVPLASLVQIATAKTVEGKLCSTEFALALDDILELRDLVSRAVPGK